MFLLPSPMPTMNIMIQKCTSLNDIQEKCRLYWMYAIYQASVIYFSIHKVSICSIYEVYEAAGITATPVGLMT